MVALCISGYIFWSGGEFPGRCVFYLSLSYVLLRARSLARFVCCWPDAMRARPFASISKILRNHDSSEHSVRRIVQMVYVCNVCMKRSGVWLVFEVVAGHASRADQTNIKYSFARTRFCSSTRHTAYSSPARRYFRVWVWLNCKYFPDRTHKHRFAYYDAAHTSAMCPRTWLNWYGSIFVYFLFFVLSDSEFVSVHGGQIGEHWGIWKV